jgi:hypothetical protein
MAFHAHSDGKMHDVDVFFEATGQLAVDKDTQNVSWARVNLNDDGMTVGSGEMTHDSSRKSGEMRRGSGGLDQSMKIYHVDGVPLAESGDSANKNGGRRQPTEHLDWGAIHLVPLGGAAAKGWMGSR